jgi:hypothetical protein
MQWPSFDAEDECGELTTSANSIEVNDLGEANVGATTAPLLVLLGISERNNSWKNDKNS